MERIWKRAEDKNVATRVIYINPDESTGSAYAYKDSAYTIKMQTSELKNAIIKRAVVKMSDKILVPVSLTIADGVATVLTMDVDNVFSFISVKDSVGTTPDEPNDPKPVDPMTLHYLTFTSKTDDFTLNAGNKTWDGTVEYSTDTENWTEWDGTSNISSVSKKLYLRGKNNTKFSKLVAGSNVGPGFIFKGPTYDTDFSTVQFDCFGNINTLLNYENPPVAIGDKCFTGFFTGTDIVTPPVLPATTLGEFCYQEMFKNCTSLTQAPELPATTLKYDCYNGMFQGCTSLTQAPELPATTLKSECYNGMFQGCTSLTTAPELPATTLEDNCYAGMFKGCTSLTAAPELPATTLVGSCYKQMFQGCTSLVTAPALPATTLVGSCYNQMFQGCTSLATAPALPATTLATYCYEWMFKDCTSLKVSATQTGEYTTAWRIPTAGTATEATDWNKDMLANTGGTFTSDPTLGTTYYIAVTPAA